MRKKNIERLTNKTFLLSIGSEGVKLREGVMAVYANTMINGQNIISKLFCNHIVKDIKINTYHNMVISEMINDVMDVISRETGNDMMLIDIICAVGENDQHYYFEDPLHYANIINTHYILDPNFHLETINNHEWDKLEMYQKLTVTK